MSSSTLYRLSGISLFIGSVLAIIGTIPYTINPDSISMLNILGSVFNLIGIMLIVLGLPGMYARQAERAGILGLIGFALTAFFLLTTGYMGNIFSAFIRPFNAAHALLHAPGPIGFVLLAFIVGPLLGVVGGILLGIATMRAATLPRWAGALLIVGMVVTFFGNFLSPSIGNIGVLIFLASLAWLAVGMLSKQPTTVEAPIPPTGFRA